MAETTFGDAVTWHPERPKYRPLHVVLAWLISTAALLVAATIVPGVSVEGFWGALAAALAIAILNALLPPIIAALRLPLMALLGFVLVLVLDALMLLAVSEIRPEWITVDNFGWALLAALVAAAATVVLDVVFGTNDDDTYTLKVVQRVAKRQGGGDRTDTPGILFLEIDGLALPILRRAMRDGNAPNMARWVAEGTHAVAEWEPDLSSQTGASQAGILLGSNDDIPAFRWVDKPSGRIIACSGPDDCAEIERDRATGIGLLINGGSSRGNLLSGEAEEVILTVSRISEEKRSNPGYRAFFANGFNVTRSLVLFFWEIVLEVTASMRAKSARRAAARPSRRHLPDAPRDDVRRRPRPDRVRRPHGHDARSSRDLRDVLELRRGRPSLGPRALRHARSAPQARPAVRANRPCPAVCAAAVRDRRPLRPRPDAGRDVQAAERLRAR